MGHRQNLCCRIETFEEGAHRQEAILTNKIQSAHENYVGVFHLFDQQIAQVAQ
ncbi:hypothetical protein D3C76_1478530 [compost metagenome]